MQSPAGLVTLTATIFGGQILAQVGGLDTGWIAPVVNAGGFGVVCWILRWFMTDVKRELIETRKELQAMRDAMNEATIVDLMSVTVSKYAGDDMKAEAERRIAEIRERSKNSGA